MADNNNPAGDEGTTPSYENIQAAFAASPELLQQWQGEFLQSQQGAAALNNHLNSNRELLKKELTGEGYKKAMTTIETTISEKLGITKPEGMKATEWLLSEFEKQAQGGSEGEELLNKINATLSEENKALKGKLKEANSGFEAYKFRSKIESSFKEGVAALNWKADIDADLFFGGMGVVTTAIERYKSTAKETGDGTLVFMDGETPILHPVTQKPATAKEVIEIKFGKYITAPSAGGGAPSGAPDATPIAEMQGFDPSKYPTKDAISEAFNAHMKAQGLPVSHPDHTKALKALLASDAFKSKN